jgi:pre-mRNA-splicing factor ISY1
VLVRAVGLTDYEVRDLNDEINKLLREKHHWESQIVFLGGANYKRAAGKMTDADGKEVPGARGYKCVPRHTVAQGGKALTSIAVQVLWTSKGTAGRQGAVRVEW